MLRYWEECQTRSDDMIEDETEHLTDRGRINQTITDSTIPFVDCMLEVHHTQIVCLVHVSSLSRANQTRVRTAQQDRMYLHSCLLSRRWACATKRKTYNIARLPAYNSQLTRGHIRTYRQSRRAEILKRGIFLSGSLKLSITSLRTLPFC